MRGATLLAAFLAAISSDPRPRLATIVSALEEKGYLCKTQSPEGYVRWCILVLYPKPSVAVGLSCDGEFVNHIGLELTPVGDIPIREAPEELLQAMEDPSLRLPAGLAPWLQECVGLVASHGPGPASLQLDGVLLNCGGAPQAPRVGIAFQTAEGKRYARGQRCQDPDGAAEQPLEADGRALGR